MIETIFFILRSLSRAQKKNPAIGIMKKIGIKSEYLKTASFEPLSPPYRHNIKYGIRMEYIFFAMYWKYGNAQSTISTR